MSPGAASADPASARAERRLRLQGLAGLTVLGCDGKPVGRVRDIYQQDAGAELAAITVMPRQLSARSVLIPAAAIAALPGERPADDAEPSAHPDRVRRSNDGAAGFKGAEPTDPQPADVVRLRIAAATAKAGLRPPDTGHATPQMLREAAAALGLDADEGTDAAPAPDAAPAYANEGAADADAPADADPAAPAPADAAPAADVDPAAPGAPAPGTSKAVEDA